MRLYQNLPKANDLVTIRTAANIVGEGDHASVTQKNIELVAESRIKYELPFRVTRAELECDEPYLVVEYDWLHFDGSKSWLQLDVPISDVQQLNGEPVQYITIPSNYDVKLSNSFPPMSMN